MGINLILILFIFYRFENKLFIYFVIILKNDVVKLSIFLESVLFFL